MAEASQESLTATRTASRCTAQTTRGTHIFEINGYSLHKGIGNGKFIRSAAFNVGGYSWCIRRKHRQSTDYISVFLQLLSQKAPVRANFNFGLVDWTTGSPTSILRDSDMSKFSTVPNAEIIQTWGIRKFMKKSDLEASAYLQDDCLVIHCDITIVKEPQVAQTAVIEVRVPPSDLTDDFGKLEFITIEDMQPGVFKALLHFMYTDSLPDIEDIELDEIQEDEDVVKHLLVAADKYALERLKLVCTDMLCRSLNLRTVVTTLALAELHSCSQLKDACVEYIMTSGKIGHVVASPGYQLLKKECPTLFVSLWEKAT
ncbi:hypothetical protein EJB05_08955, partial [Eragrostis curvula]